MTAFDIEDDGAICYRPGCGTPAVVYGQSCAEHGHHCQDCGGSGYDRDLHYAGGGDWVCVECDPIDLGDVPNPDEPDECSLCGAWTLDGAGHGVGCDMGGRR